MVKITYYNMSEDLTQEVTQLYYAIYGSDIRIAPVANKPYLGLVVKNGDYDVTGIVSGNAFNEAIVITKQRYLTTIFTPLSDDGLDGSNFSTLTKQMDGVDLNTKINVLKAELILASLKVPQIQTIDSITHKVSTDGSSLEFIIGFTTITDESSNLTIMEAI